MKISSFSVSIFVMLLSAACALALSVTPLKAQEINARITIDRSRVDNVSLNYMDTFAGELEEYLNNYEWTSRRFNDFERINLEMSVILQGVDNNYNFEASLVVRSTRPIYNTMQQTTLFLFSDENWVFHYAPNRRLVHDLQLFDGVATLLDFYAYLILGHDFDSFSELGGTSYFTQAQNLVALAQSSGGTGWTQGAGARRSRAQLVADLMNPGYESLRRAIYHYHRQGLDRFMENPGEARKKVLEALEMIREARRRTTSNFLFDIFFNAKYREIVSVFEDAGPDVRLQAYNLLSEIDQSHLSEYDRLQ